MILLIYNLSGLLVGLAGLLAGFAAMMATERIAVGVLAMAATWAGLGLWYRRRPARDGSARPYPSLFFIPLPFLAIPLVLAGVVLVFVESAGKGRALRDAGDSRSARLKADVSALGEAHDGGDARLSATIRAGLRSEGVAGAEGLRLLTRLAADAVLVLVEAPGLKEMKPPARVQLLATIIDTLKSDPRTSGKRRYIGVRGLHVFGATVVPPDAVKVGAIVDDDPLFAFYDAPETTAPTSASAPAPAPSPEPTSPPPAPTPTPARPPVVAAKPATAPGPGAGPTDRLMADLAGPDGVRRRVAMRTLATAPRDEARRPEVVRLVKAAIDDPASDAATVGDAFPTLVAWADPAESIATALGRLDDNLSDVRRAAIRALLKGDDPRIVPALARRLEVGPRNEVTLIAMALKERAKEAEPALIGLLKSPDPSARANAATALVDFGGPDSAEALRLALDDPDSGARVAIRLAQGRLARRLGLPAEPAKAKAKAKAKAGP